MTTTGMFYEIITFDEPWKVSLPVACVEKTITTTVPPSGGAGAGFHNSGTLSFTNLTPHESSTVLLSSPSNTFNRLLGRDREIGRLCFSAKPALGALLASLTARAPSNHNQCTQRLWRSFYGVAALFGVIFCCRFSNHHTEDHTILHRSEMLLGQKGKIISKRCTMPVPPGNRQLIDGKRLHPPRRC